MRTKASPRNWVQNRGRLLSRGMILALLLLVACGGQDAVQEFESVPEPIEDVPSLDPVQTNTSAQEGF